MTPKPSKAFSMQRVIFSTSRNSDCNRPWLFKENCHSFDQFRDNWKIRLPLFLARMQIFVFMDRSVHRSPIQESHKSKAVKNKVIYFTSNFFPRLLQPGTCLVPWILTHSHQNSRKLEVWKKSGLFLEVWPNKVFMGWSMDQEFPILPSKPFGIWTSCASKRLNTILQIANHP